MCEVRNYAFMPHYAYIDESGTLDHQEVMLVALVVFEGKNSAEKIHLSALKRAFPESAQKNKDRTNKRQPKLQLHYAELANDRRIAAALSFAQSKIACYASSYWHDGNSKRHKTRFAIYTELVKSCIYRSLEHHDELEVLIAQQGGASYYKRNFLTELRSVPEEYRKDGRFKKAKFELAGTVPGVQIADFYAGATRDFLLSQNNVRRKQVYDLLEKQVLCIETIGYELPSKQEVGLTSHLSQ
jgi:hypothetical protein